MPTQTLADLPEYHDDLLIVKVRPDPGLQAMAGIAAVDFADSAASPGLSAVAFYERAGLIRQVVPLHAGSANTRAESFANGALAGVAAAAASFGASPSPNDGVTVLQLRPGADATELQRALAQDATIEYVGPVPARYLMADATVAANPPAADTLWNLRKIRWPEARAAGLPSPSAVRVAVLDTGVDPGHPDLPPLRRYVHDYGIPGGATSSIDAVGHGTHVTGTIGARINNSLGINGICDCSISVLKIFNDEVTYIASRNAFVYLVDPILYRAALADCIEQGEQVVNLSIGGYGAPDPQERQLFKQLVDNGCIVVAAMGNENTSKPAYPAAIPGVVAVGATGLDDRRANFSNSGNHISLSAPGVAIWSTLPTYPGQTGFRAVLSAAGKPVPGAPLSRDVMYAAWDGTSMATPHVAATAALSIAKHGSATALQKLKNATDRVPAMGSSAFTTEYGSGRLNLLRV